MHNRQNDFEIGDLVPGGIMPSDHLHRGTNDRTCSRCRRLVDKDEVPLLVWTDSEDDMYIFCPACLLGIEP